MLRTASSLETAPEDKIVQLVKIETFWRSVPGRTVAHRTQLNATVTYCVISPAIVAGYEGAGSLFLAKNKKSKELSGELELARLKPTQVIIGGDPVFTRSEVQATFRAIHDPRKVTGLVNQMDRMFNDK